eukprot:Anaeramoba_ignava/a348632_77.p1 GENE.a348632_77~~a348632_77.p1  ORF type:complete len:348 (+),score=99.79 a348632_77:33-1076(+)
MSNKTNVVVVDNGEFEARIGFGGEKKPQFTISKDITTTKYNKTHKKIPESNKPKLEEYWTSIQKKLGINPIEYSMLVTETPLQPKQIRQTNAEILFETLHFKEAFFALQNVLALFATGKSTGVSVNFGYSTTSIVPIYRERIFPFAIQRLEIGAFDIEDVFLEQLIKNEHNLSIFSKNNLDVRDLKETQLEFRRSTNINENYPNPKNVPVKGAENLEIEFSDQHWKAPEILFSPRDYGVQFEGIHKLLVNSIYKRSPIYSRKSLITNILLFGGTSRIAGLSERLAAEVQFFIPSTVVPQITIETDDQQLPFVGGSIVGSYFLKDDSSWISYSDYSEFGPNICFEKCF